eukprot:9054716-Pyramimonas_sp.AAC.1
MQQLVAKKIIIIEPVVGGDNLADLGATVLPRARLERLRESCRLKEVPVPGTWRVAAVGAMPTDSQAQSTLLKVLIAVAASLPTAVQGSSTELCEAPQEVDGSAVTSVAMPGVTSEGYYVSLAVLMAGVGL